MLAPSAGSVWLAGEDVTRPSAGRSGCAPAWHARSRSRTLAPHLPVQRQVELALFEREGLDRPAVALGRCLSGGRGARRKPCCESLRPRRASRAGDRARSPTASSAWSRWRWRWRCGRAVLLLDEPMAGVPRGEGRGCSPRSTGCRPTLAVLIIEHDMDLVFRFAQRIVVLAEGAVLADGTPEEIRRDPAVRAAYLGTSDVSRAPARTRRRASPATARSRF